MKQAHRMIVAAVKFMLQKQFPLQTNDYKHI
jgi:hypothetical protein